MNGKITANQFFTLFFLSSVYYLSTISSESLKDNFGDTLISIVLSMVLSVLLSLPLILMHDKTDNYSTVNRMREKFKGFTKVILAVYIIYFIFSDVIIITLIQSLVTNTVYPETPPMFIGLLSILVAIYGAVKGIEVVARSGLFIFVIMLVGVTGIIIGALSLFRWNNREVLMYNGVGDALSNSLVIFARSTFLPQMVFLLASVKEKVLMKSIWWSIGTAVFSLSIFFFVIHCLGAFVHTQLFPVYALSSVSQLAPIQRLDIVSSAVWLTTLVVRLSCDLLAVKACMKTSLCINHSKGIIIGTGIVILGLSAFFSHNLNVISIVNSSVPMFILAIVLGFIVPSILSFRKGGAK